MRYLKEQIEEKIIIKKSEFIGILYPIETDEDINKAILDAKKRYPKATHYVTANIRGVNGEYASSNDDGEPSRTAGYPVLEVLMRNNLTDILCVVIRYFGGIKLGAGGLIRAYSSSASEVLKHATLYEKVMAKKYQITFPYNLIDTIKHLLENDCKILEEKYLENVTFTFIFLNNGIEILDDIIHQLISVTELEAETLHIDINKGSGND
ncbi:MAG TPA: YigZ family protein [Acholeplasmataceae bacterium]|nr:YigZ family protein [Acholeplasmataceae bacterium]